MATVLQFNSIRFELFCSHALGVVGTTNARSCVRNTVIARRATSRARRQCLAVTHAWACAESRVWAVEFAHRTNWFCTFAVCVLCATRAVFVNCESLQSAWY